MDGRGLGQDAVHIEQASADAVGKPQHDGDPTRRGR
jgi:hypothetical protein